ncbi:hypothetical protein [Cohnella sp. JJ-181]|uniref:hypothetical protein n=1 Tax=Cohnella rhizoplanae TaxID=2974897 RepID=UPI0022FFAB58|nr:hypothetical protein [Cohnella sp. JJ-181]CAI6075870.1 hypothetical protein COHCIP112018_02495 [Cohnella sp. JJ-181]
MATANAKKRRALAIACAASVLALTACQSHNLREQSARQAADAQQGADDMLKLRSVQPPQVAGQPDPAVIPSVGWDKTRTTNQHGATGYGMGSGVLSRIGSSGLRGQGVSSDLEAELTGAGIVGVRVFVADDTIILAANERGPTDGTSDPLQRKLLSNTAGSSGKGPEPGPHGGFGISTIDTEALDTLTTAEQWLKKSGFGERIVTVASPEAVATIDRLRAQEANGASGSRDEDIAKLMRMAAASKDGK